MENFAKEIKIMKVRGDKMDILAEASTKVNAKVIEVTDKYLQGDPILTQHEANRFEGDEMTGDTDD